MNGINFQKIKYLWYQVSKQLKNQIPYKYRKVFLLLSNLIGLITYFKILLNITGSPYLQIVPQFFKTIVNIFEETGNLELFILFLICLLLLIISKCYSYKKANESISLYKQIKFLFACAYFFITLLGILPMVLPWGI